MLSWVTFDCCGSRVKKYSNGDRDGVCCHLCIPLAERIEIKFPFLLGSPKP